MVYILLILIGIILIIFSRDSGVKKNNHKEESFSSIMEEKNLSHTKYDMELIAIRKDMAESILDLQHEIQEVKEMITHKDCYEKNTYNNIKVEHKKEDVISEINFNNLEKVYKNEKVDNIKNLIQQGKSDDEICELLGVGKGEVLLIRGLYK